MLCNRVHVSEEIGVNKTRASKECNICHYCYFLNYSFTFEQKYIVLMSEIGVIIY